VKVGDKMSINRVALENFTVFDHLDLHILDGINVFIGENGLGKTHILKVIYSACKAAQHDVSFPQKVVKVFYPDGSNILRLVSRKNKGGTASAKVYSDTSSIGMTFTTRTKRFYADVKSEDAWERQQGDLTCTFIPAKEILSNAWNLESAVSAKNVEFDDTYIDIIVAAKVNITAGRDSRDRERLLRILQQISDGTVHISEDRFYLRPGSQAMLEFNLIAEGIRKIALLWQLIKNGTLERGSILIWDEPEANLNPVHIPVIAHMLLELQRSGVQILIATHDYFLCRFLEIKREDADKLVFHSLYREDSSVKCESEPHFDQMEHNKILEVFVSMYDGQLAKDKI
jgi:predicted ATPase